MNTYLAYHPVVPWAQLCQLVAYILTVPTLCPTHLVERSTCTLPTQATPVGHVYIKQVGIRWLSGSSICGANACTQIFLNQQLICGNVLQGRFVIVSPPKDQ